MHLWDYRARKFVFSFWQFSSYLPENTSPLQRPTSHVTGNNRHLWEPNWTLCGCLPHGKHIISPLQNLVWKRLGGKKAVLSQPKRTCKYNARAKWRPSERLSCYLKSYLFTHPSIYFKYWDRTVVLNAAGQRVARRAARRCVRSFAFCWRSHKARGWGCGIEKCSLGGGIVCPPWGAAPSFTLGEENSLLNWRGRSSFKHTRGYNCCFPRFLPDGSTVTQLTWTEQQRQTKHFARHSCGCYYWVILPVFKILKAAQALPALRNIYVAGWSS
jgi:hypothetical protein